MSRQHSRERVRGAEPQSIPRSPQKTKTATSQGSPEREFLAGGVEPQSSQKRKMTISWDSPESVAGRRGGATVTTTV